jgi:transcriptional regulator with XRE-family HTH domain
MTTQHDTPNDADGKRYAQLAGRNPLPYLRAWRGYRGYGLVEMAEKSGVSKAQIVNLELHGGRATIQTVNKLAAALRIKPQMLVFVNPEDLPEETGAA